MAAPEIPVALLGVQRRLTTNEIAIYHILPDELGQPTMHPSDWPQLEAYAFELPSLVMDQDRLYTLTIHLRDNLPPPVAQGNPENPPVNNTNARRRRAPSRRRRRGY